MFRKLSDRLRLIALLTVTLCLILVLLLLLGSPTGLILTVLTAGTVLILLTVLRTISQVRSTGQSLLAVTQGDAPALSRLQEEAANDPAFSELSDLIIRYAGELTRQSTAQIFDKQTELNALQSQINPHFLYNTLETIRGQALLDGNQEIARMTEALGAFFRYSISRKGTLVTLRDELANINNYMLIQSYRFNNRFSLDIVMDEEDEAALDDLVPRLIIQPVVENAIFHGLEDREEGGKVTIEIILTETSLFLMISDNGKGIPEDELAALNERIHAPDRKLESADGDARRTGIALPNIHRRIQLLFGEDYGVSVYSTPGQGTDVEIVIPARRETVHI